MDDGGFPFGEDPPPPPDMSMHGPDGIPVIRVVAGDLHITASEGEAALIAKNLPIYQRGHSLVRPVMQEVPSAKGRMTVSASLIPLSQPSLIDALCNCARWERYDGRAKDWITINPPKNVAETILSRVGLWTFSKIAGVISTPTIRADGSLLSKPGYDERTRFFHVSDGDMKLRDVVHNPSKDDAFSALQALTDLTSEFPFASRVSRSVALSAMISPVVRGAMSVVPMHVFRASTAGTGKSYMADTASMIATGRPCPVAAAGHTEEETEKRLAGLLLGGYPLINLDNVNGELGGDLLCQAIERPLIRLRPLGSSSIIELETRSVVFGTGNGLRVRGDMTRRTLICDLDANLERPEEREFAFDPVAAVMADRSRYVSACITIVRAYLKAGSPNKCRPLASFSEWSDLVRSALVWLGCADPVESMESAREDDPELLELQEFMAAWKEAFPVNYSVTSTVLVQRTNEKAEDGSWAWPILREIVHRFAGDRGGSVNMTTLGRRVRKYEGRLVGGFRIRKAGATHGQVRYELQKV